MNILFFAHESRLGGANLSLLGMIEQMQDRHNISVVVPIKEGFMVDELKKRKIPVYYRHSFWWMLAPEGTSGKTILKKMVYKILCLYNYLSALRLKKIIKKQKIDVIHTNSGVLNTGGILAAMTGIPHVWHIREFGQEDFGFFPVWNYERICRFIDSHSTKVVVISQAIAQKFKKMISPEKLEIVYNGVSEKNKIKKTEVKGNGDRIEFLISSRISHEKGQDEAVRAVALLLKKGYRNFHLSIAGPGNAAFLKNMILKEKIDDFVSILGTVEDMPALRRDMDVELVCSLCEGFGRVTVEAMMASNPVIGSDTGATPELVKSGENGYLYRKGQAADLAQKMEIFLKKPEQIRHLGNRAYEWSTKMFTAQQNAKKIERLYQKIREY